MRIPCCRMGNLEKSTLWLVGVTVLAWLALLAAGLAAPAPAATLAAGYWHCLGVGADGRVVAWGGNSSHQCNVPAAAQSGVIAVAAGWGHSLALKADGSIVAWGDNSFGQCVPPWKRLNGMLMLLLPH